MKLKNLLSENNLTLYKKISARFPIQLKKSDDHLWRSILEDKRIVISYSKTSRAQACFTHELLHIDTQLNGYRRLRSGLSLNNAVYQQLPFLCPMIDNEFQHHKMFRKFIGMGYQANEFYHEADSVAEQYITTGIAAKGQSLTSITSIYFALIAPGISIPPNRIIQLKEEFRKYDEGAFRERLDTIDKMMEAWTADTSNNAMPYIKEVLSALGCADTWISYVYNASNFPEDGFFVGSPFTLEDIHHVMAKSK